MSRLTSRQTANLLRAAALQIQASPPEPEWTPTAIRLLLAMESDLLRMDQGLPPAVLARTLAGPMAAK